MRKTDKIKNIEDLNKRLLSENDLTPDYEGKLEMIGHEMVMLYTKMEEEKGKEFADKEIKYLLDGVLAGTINSSDMESDEGWGGHFTKNMEL